MHKTVTSDSDTLDMLRQSARAWVEAEHPLQPDHEQAREGLRDRWQAMSALGWTGATIAEAHGGLSLGLDAYTTIATALGRHLVVSPLLSTGLLASHALVGRPKMLSEIVAGRLIVAYAIDEGARHGSAIHAEAVAADGGWRLRAEKRYVIDGSKADIILIVTRDSRLFLVESDRCVVTPLNIMDGREMAHISADTWLPSDACVEIDADGVERLSDLARIGLAAEMIGVATHAIEMIADYLKTREQFGRRIGSFQALQHRAAQMVVDVSLATACLSEAVSGELTSAAAILTKYAANDAIHRVSNEIVQMHGGIGMTAEHPAGRILKYARVSEMLFGDSAFLADRYATIHGF